MGAGRRDELFLEGVRTDFFAPGLRDEAVFLRLTGGRAKREGRFFRLLDRAEVFLFTEVFLFLVIPKKLPTAFSNDLKMGMVN